MIALNNIFKLKITLSACLIAILVIISFLPSLKNEFVNWDDDLYITKNTTIQNLSPGNIKQIFTSFFVGNYQPVTMLSYMFEYRFFKLNPFGYHLTSLILHLLNSFLVFWLIYILTRHISISLIAAILFGIHPLHVESVVWISERKDVLYALFFLNAIICYLYYLRSNRKLRYYLLCLFLFLVSLLSKSMAVTLPILLLLIDYFTLKRWNKGMLLNKIPFFVLSFIFVAIAMFSQKTALRQEIPSFLNRIGIASYGIIFYLYKILLPVNLSCLYPYSPIKNIFLQPVYLCALLVFIALIISLFISIKYTKKILFGVIFFLITIMPVLQFIPLGQTIVADRYTYVASIGMFYIIAEFFMYLCNRPQVKMYVKLFLAVSLAMLVFNYVSIARDRCEVWENDYVLWSDVITKYPDGNIPTVYFNRGLFCASLNANKLALSDFEKALRLWAEWEGSNPNNVRIYDAVPVSGEDYTKIFCEFGKKYAEVGQPQASVLILKSIISRNPNNINANLYLCVTYGALGQYKDAIQFGKKAIELDPNLGFVHYNLAVAYHFNNQYQLAFVHLEKALQLGVTPSKEFLSEFEQSKPIVR